MPHYSSCMPSIARLQWLINLVLCALIRLISKLPYPNKQCGLSIRTYQSISNILMCKRSSDHLSVVNQNQITTHLCSLSYRQTFPYIINPLTPLTSAQHSRWTKAPGCLNCFSPSRPERCGEVAEGPGSWPATSTTHRPSTKCRKHGDLFSLAALKSLT